MSKFKIGDKVICIREYDNCDDIVGLRGRIVQISEKNKTYAVDFEKEFDQGHDCGGLSREYHGWWTKEDCLKLIGKRKIKQYGIVKFCKEKYGV